MPGLGSFVVIQSTSGSIPVSNDAVSLVLRHIALRSFCAASWSTTAREIQAGGHHPASLTSAALPGLLSYGTSSYFIADDPSPFPSGCAQPSSTPLIKSHRPSPRSNEDTTDTGGPLGPTFVGSVYTMGDRARKQMVSLGPVQQLPSGNSLPGFLGAMNDTPIGRAVEKGLLWWVNRGRETPRFEFFLDKEAASELSCFNSFSIRHRVASRLWSEHNQMCGTRFEDIDLILSTLSGKTR